MSGITGFLLCPDTDWRLQDPVNSIFRQCLSSRALLGISVFFTAFTSCERKPEGILPVPVSMTGVWVGSIDDSTLQLVLTEEPSDSVFGLIIHTLRSEPETLVVY